jgi:CMP-N-acetylneuraminic acid synthetase
MKVLGIIPARGGSKGIPRKNIVPLLGKPLIAYTAEAALAAKRLTRVVLSTEDEEIAEIGRQWGLDVPFLRPPELARDDTPTLPVLQHALRWLEENETDFFHYICILQPTHPLRCAADIDGCIELIEREQADTVFTILPVPYHYNPRWVYFQDAQGGLHLSTGDIDPIPRRQELPAAFHREGSVYISRRDIVMTRDTFYGKRVLGYPIKPARSINIDAPEDLEQAKNLLKGYGTRTSARMSPEKFHE